MRWLENRERGQSAALWRRCKRALVRRFNRLNAPVVYPWSPSRSGNLPAHELHRLAAALLSRRARGVAARVWLWTKAALWPAVATVAAVPVIARCGPRVRDLHGQSIREQWRDVLEAIWKHGIFPTEYFHHRVFHGRARTEKALYLNEREMLALLSAADRGADAPRVDQLRRFHSECRACGLPVPRTLAAFRSGTIEFFSGTGPGVLLDKDLFVRPEVWGENENGQCWRWNPQARGWSFRGEVLGVAGFLQRCRSVAGDRPFVLQECLHNHPEVVRFSAGGLCTIRLATGLDEHGEVVPLFATFNLPSSDGNGAITPAGKLTAGVAVTSGHLMPAAGDFLTDGEFDTHPGTGAIITGTALAQWSSVVDLATRAHRRFDDVPFVGWEIALAGGGPVLLEASTNWGLFTHVLPAETRFAELCLQRLAALKRADLGVHSLTRVSRVETGVAAVEAPLASRGPAAAGDDSRA